MKSVLADVLIIALLPVAGPVYAIAATALIVIGGFLRWYLTERADTAGVETDDLSLERRG